ncbi:TetR/AcrR family transcriptional regulator [Amaricoccus sp.]|uniref:TetR/AcrR family transcriptional regulator n=1 Tax=Amaricoccus sp. TaxID=1872485 RepID=UPI002604569B|nr:TetR/AcrR family transcriptional regulator [uncultured Amaricoccus sp.]
MTVPSQRIEIDRPVAVPAKGPRARTFRLMVEAASEMLREGGSPTVSEVAERAGVSRSTAYRYFPTRDVMVRAVVAEALGPVLDWTPPDAGREARVASLFETSFPRLLASEATFRAALRQSLEHGDDAPPRGRRGRGHRIELLELAITNTRGRPAGAAERRLAQALSLVFGVESIVVLKDIWGLGDDAVCEVALWTARALTRAAAEEKVEVRSE